MPEKIGDLRVLQILHNPRYAGGFVYGRTRKAYNAKLKSVQLRVAKSDWEVLIPEAREGYISWAEYERNQTTLNRTPPAFLLERGRMPRQGSALLHGCCAAAAVHACASITSHSRGGCARIMSATKPSCGTPANIANGCAALQSTTR
ncbi:recombinase family protein [Mesorhizobium sp. M0976]|uniref:recombinase family protein n=1 Tax=Mesorhizobium sp. M0976 TaxID=2957038 RepID=UPI0033373FFE